MSTHPAKSNFSRGATLVEVLVAVVVLVVGIVPAVYTARLALNVSNSIKNNLIAAYLAQEGIEVARAIRDENWFSGSVSFSDRLGTGSYEVAWDTLNPVPFTGNPLRRDAAGVYNYISGTITPFSRRIDTNIVSPDEIVVQSTVTWNERGRDKIIVVESHLFNWR